MLQLTYNEKKVYDYLIKSDKSYYFGNFPNLSVILKIKEKELKIAVVSLMKMKVVWYQEDPETHEDFTLRLSKKYRVFDEEPIESGVEMTLDEFCAKFGYSESSVRVQFKRTQEQMRKRGYILEKSSEKHPRTRYYVRNC